MAPPLGYIYGSRRGIFLRDERAAAVSFTPRDRAPSRVLTRACLHQGVYRCFCSRVYKAQALPVVYMKLRHAMYMLPR